MHNKHWSSVQLGDFPYRSFRRRASDQTPEDGASVLVIIGWLVLMTCAVFGALHLVRVL